MGLYRDVHIVAFVEKQSTRNFSDLLDQLNGTVKIIVCHNHMLDADKQDWVQHG